MSRSKEDKYAELDKLIQANRIKTDLVQEHMGREMTKDSINYQYPATIGQAKLHRKAAKFGFRRDLKGEIPVVDPDCNLRVDSEPISICYSTSDSSVEVQQNYEEFKLPPGVTLFFSLAKAELVYLLLITLFSGYYIYFKGLCRVQDFFPTISIPVCEEQFTT